MGTGSHHKSILRSKVCGILGMLLVYVPGIMSCSEAPPPSLPSSSVEKAQGKGGLDGRGTNPSASTPNQIPSNQSQQTVAPVLHGTQKYAQQKDWKTTEGPKLQSWTVPPGVKSVSIHLWGGNGKSSGGEGGGGAYASKTLNVQPGMTLDVEFFYESTKQSWSVRVGSITAGGGQYGAKAQVYSDPETGSTSCSGGAGGAPGTASGGDKNVDGKRGKDGCTDDGDTSPKGADPTGERSIELKNYIGSWPAAATLIW